MESVKCFLRPKQNNVLCSTNPIPKPTLTFSAYLNTSCLCNFGISTESQTDSLVLSDYFIR